MRNAGPWSLGVGWEKPGGAQSRQCGGLADFLLYARQRSSRTWVEECRKNPHKVMWFHSRVQRSLYSPSFNHLVHFGWILPCSCQVWPSKSESKCHQHHLHHHYHHRFGRTSEPKCFNRWSRTPWGLRDPTRWTDRTGLGPRPSMDWINTLGIGLNLMGQVSLCRW